MKKGADALWNDGYRARQWDRATTDTTPEGALMRLADAYANACLWGGGGFKEREALKTAIREFRGLQCWDKPIA